MVGKSEIKLLRSLQLKKFRQQEQCFTAEGIKVISELLNSPFELVKIYTTHPGDFRVDSKMIREIDEATLKKISALTTPNQAVAVFRMKPEAKLLSKGLVVALDDVRDPGNLGTIIRLCDWFGVEQLWCSRQTADCYNQKVVQASMGSLARVNISYVDLEVMLRQTELPVFATAMDGDPVYEAELPGQAVLLMGNEANGVSESLMRLSRRNLTIPRFGRLQETESLNVATATAILLSEFRRR